VFLTGLNVVNLGFPTTLDNALSSALMYQAAPSSYMSSADPAIFGDREVVFSSIADNRSYTARDNLEFFRDAGLARARALASVYIGFVKFADSAHFPNVDVYAEKGSGLDTAVGARLPDLSTGQLVDASTVLLSRDGDSNQEDITNDSIKVWSQMKCYHFELNDNAGISHFDLPSNSSVLQRLLTHLDRQRSNCP
jgi:lysophospholipase-3